MRIVRTASLVVFGIAASLAAFGQDKPRPASPNFGTTTLVYQRLSPMDFNKLTSGPGSGEASFVTYYLPELASYSLTIYPNASSFFDTRHLFASPHLPGGALLKYVELDYCDTNTGAERVHLEVRDCNYNGDCSSTPLSNLVSLGNVGCSYVADQSLAYTVDNFRREILIDVSFDATDGTDALAGVIVGYVLQVSPGGSQTFGDVPPSDPGFQYISALVASGITAGCGSGNYCPDSPLTRRQMAVFLAKALGLNWGQ